MTSQTGQQIVQIHTSPNISRRKGNQIIKLGQLIEYNRRNTLFEAYMQNVVERLVPDPFIKNQNSDYLWNKILK